MSQPEPLLHIGYPKCLSTWLQQCLFRTDWGFANPMNPFDIQLELVSPNPLDFDAAEFRDSFLGRYNEKFGNSGLVSVCSSENLVGAVSHNIYNARYNADKLHRCFPNGKVLIVIREQRSMLRSLYRTLVAWGMPYPLEKLLEPQSHWQHIAPSFNLDTFEYHRLIAYYQGLFGVEQVKVLCFEQFSDNPQSFTREVLDFCNIEYSAGKLESLPHERMLNPGSSLFGIEKKRLANRLYRSIYNANGFLEETEERQYRRMASFRKREEGWLDRVFSPRMERRFNKVLVKKLAGRFEISNVHTAALTGLDLAEMGYSFPASD